MKSSLGRLVNRLESASRHALERPFREGSLDAEDYVREILRIMHAEKLELLDGFYVPDHFTLRLPRSLYREYQGYIGERLCQQIAEELHRQLEHWNYEVQCPIRVQITDASTDDPGRVEIEHRFYDEKAARAKEYRVLPASDPLEHFRRGRQLQAQQRLTEASREFLAALRSNRRLAPAYFNLGSIAFQQCRYQESVLYYGKGLEIEPDQAAAHADVAKAYEMLGEWEQAIQHLSKAAQSLPDHPVVQRRLARVQEESKLYGLLRTRLETEFIDLGSQDLPEQFRLRHFTLYCPNALPPNKRNTLETMLENIYDELGAIFATYPSERIEVRVRSYREDDSRSLPSWAAACYDGRIHLIWNRSRPVELAVAYILLRHEYTHLLISRIAKRGCPSWLEEGLAELMSRKLMMNEKQMLRRAVHQGRAIPISQLGRGFQRLPRAQIRLAYVQSYDLTAYLIKKYGLLRILRMLHRLGEGAGWWEVLQDELHLNSSRLEREWLDAVRRQRS